MNEEKRVCRVCETEKVHRFDKIAIHGEFAVGRKVFRDENGRRWYNAVCGDCFLFRQRNKKVKAE